jgi:hypothetical protein
MLLCTIKYDAKHLQANKDKKLQNKQIYKIAKHLQTSKNIIFQKKKLNIKLSKVQGFMFVSKTIYNKPCTRN